MIAFIVIFGLGVLLFLADAAVGVFNGDLWTFAQSMTWWMWIITIGFGCSAFFDYEEW